MREKVDTKKSKMKFMLTFDKLNIRNKKLVINVQKLNLFTV